MRHHLLSYIEVNLPGFFEDPCRREHQMIVSRMAPGPNVIFSTMPGTDDIDLVLVIASAVTSSVSVHDFLYEPEKSPLANRSALMRACIVPSEEFPFQMEHAYLKVTDGDDLFADALQLFFRAHRGDSHRRTSQLTVLSNRERYIA